MGLGRGGRGGVYVGVAGSCSAVKRNCVRERREWCSVLASREGRGRGCSGGRTMGDSLLPSAWTDSPGGSVFTETSHDSRSGGFAGR